MAPIEIDVAELLRALDRAVPLLLLDLRNAEDAAAWRIEARWPFAKLNVPYFEFVEDADAAIARVPRDRPIAAVCATGDSSAYVAELLRNAGFEARTLAGGMAGYADHLEPVAIAPPPGEVGRFEIWQVQRRARGCLSYVVRAGGEALVVDPSRHVERYEAFVAALGARIVRVIDTHVHADHLSGGPALAARSGAAYSIGAHDSHALARGSDVLRDGDRFCLGGLRRPNVGLEVLATPGHTPGCASLLVGKRHLLTGDLLHASGVGRPDLGGFGIAWAQDLVNSLHVRLARLPDDVVVLPAHSSGLEEADGDGVVCRLLGDLRRDPRFASAAPETLARDLPPPPASYAEIVNVNCGLREASAGEADLWEHGKNECAASFDRRACGNQETADR